MGFMDSYKHLEKICNEIYNSDKQGISLYIEDMKNTDDGAYFVNGWNDDLKTLKHYRWIRNQISHEPNCSEETMCKLCDTQWLNRFCSRILSQDDPLSLYRKAKSKNKPNANNVKSTYNSGQNTHAGKLSDDNNTDSQKLTALILIVFILILLMVMFSYILK